MGVGRAPEDDVQGSPGRHILSNKHYRWRWEVLEETEQRVGGPRVEEEGLI